MQDMKQRYYQEKCNINNNNYNNNNKQSIGNRWRYIQVEIITDKYLCVHIFKSFVNTVNDT